MGNHAETKFHVATHSMTTCSRINLLIFGCLLATVSAVDLGMFSTMPGAIFQGAPNDKPRTSYVERPQRIRIFKNGVLQVDPYANKEPEEKENKEPAKQDFHKFWKQVDSDESGVLSMEEFVTSMRIPLEDGSMKKDDLPEMFNSADQDGSGELTFKEVRDFLYKDQGYDPVVEESKATAGSEAKFDSFWEQIDSDRDLIMSRGEFEHSMRGAVESGHMPVEQMNEMFLRMDSDKDGIVSKEEAKLEIKNQMQQQQQQQQQQGGAPPGEGGPPQGGQERFPSGGQQPGHGHREF